MIGIFQLAMRMGVMNGCDNGNRKWMKDVIVEGGLDFNTQCAKEEATKVSGNKAHRPML